MNKSSDVNTWYVYILSCSDASLYTGVTTEPRRRLALHRAGKGARYTRARRVDGLVYLETAPDRSTAQKREWAIKALSRPEKDELIAGSDNALEILLAAGVVIPEDLCR